jgi:hypothetical protein
VTFTVLVSIAIGWNRMIVTPSTSNAAAMNLQTRALAAILLTATAEALPLPAAPQLAALQLSQIPASKGPEKGALVLLLAKLLAV